MEAIVNASAVRAESRNFYLWMAGIFLLVAFGGFTPTYWAKIATGSFHAEPIIHIHGILLFSWTCFYFVQTALVASGRTLDHRAWGLAGISLFTAMMFSILAGQEAVLHRNELLGFGDGARRFAAVTLTAWPLMAAMFTLAIVNIRKPEVHKRLMTLLMIAMMTPALARVFLTLLAPPGAAAGGPPPAFVSLPPGLVADLLLILVIVRDWRMLGRPHPVYVYGGLVLVLQQVLTVPFAATATWMHLAKAFQSLAG
jgi:ABC-type multidrug transport system fused ATPase/permease subunit